MFRHLYQTVAGWFGGDHKATGSPDSGQALASPGFGRSWTLAISRQCTATFHPAWYIPADDTDLVKWCKGKRGVDPEALSELLRGWLYLAEADERPKLTLLVAGGQPQVVVEHGTGRMLGQVRRAAGSGDSERAMVGPTDLLSAARHALNFAVTKGKLPPLYTELMPEGSGHGSAMVLIAPTSGMIRVYNTLPPDDAPDTNVWWGEVAISGTVVGKLSPQCRDLVMDGKWVKAGDEIGRFAGRHVRLARNKEHTPRPTAPPSWPAALAGFTRVAPRFVEKAVQKMLASAGPEVAAALGPVGPPDLDLFVWLMASGDAEQQRLRAQALKTYPLLTAVLAEKGLASMAAVTEAIDGKRPLEPTLTKLLHTRSAVLKAAAPLKARSIGRGRFVLLAQGALEAAARLPPDQLPGRGVAPRDREWRVFLDIYAVLQTNRGALLDLTTFTNGGLVWAQTTKEQAHGIRGRAQHIADCLHAAWQDLLIPNLVALSRLHGDPLQRQSAERLLGPAVAGAILRGGRGFGALEDLAERWDEERSTIGSAAVRLSRNFTWPPLSEPFRHAETGLVVVPLTSTAELEAEGKAQKHCLDATYVDGCLFGPVHILSVRRSNEERVSTAEVVIEVGRPVLCQHFGFRNVDPSPEAEKALEDYLDGVANDSIPVAWNFLYRDLNRRCLAEQNVSTREFPYDVMDDLIADRVFEAWRFILPGPHRKLTRQAWREAAGLPQMLELPVLANTSAILDNKADRPE